MEAILDFRNELDIALLDKVVHAFFAGKGVEQQQANKVLTQFKEHPDAWSRVDGILEKSTLTETKFIALQILETLIGTMWKALPPEQREGIKNYIVAFIIKSSSDEATLEKQKPLLRKLNFVLVQILKQEWPHNWPTFIPEIVNSSKSNLALCENNMSILKLLSEEIFDFSNEQMTQQKTKNLKNQMCGEFSEIYQLCYEILEKAQKPSLISATLETLLRFLNWIPLGYIFETPLITVLHSRFLGVPQFRNVTLKCMTEIGSLQVGPEYSENFVVLFHMVMSSIRQVFPPNTDLVPIWEDSTDEDQNYIQNLAMFLCQFFTVHLKSVEKEADKTDLIDAHIYLINISRVKEREIFKICLEYWAKLVAELYDEIQNIPHADVPLLNLSYGGMATGAAIGLRKHIYQSVLSSLRVVMIERMVRPEEVLIVENDEGEIVREFVKESDTIVLYKSMREVLVYLTHLDVEDTEGIMTEKLSRQMDGSEWSWDNLNTLCWAIGSISGAMNEETEKRFLVTVIKDLLVLCEMKRGKDNKAVVASNIMYVVGQYPRFLKAHWKFLKTVVNKLFEFMHELHEGVQDMACDTFIKIAQKCKRHFVMQQAGEIMPYIEEIIATTNQITSDLQPQQVHTFYEAVGHMISAQTNKAAAERLMIKYMEIPNQAWDTIMSQAAQNVDVLNDPSNVKILANILKTNVSACTAVGPLFYNQMGRLYMDLLGLYKAVSEIISEAVTTQGPIATHTPRVRGYRTIKKEVLKLIEIFVNKADDLEAVNRDLIPPLLETILGDYARGAPPARDAEVLSVMASIVARLQTLMTDRVFPIFEAVFECTLNMINTNFEEFPEHRVSFFRLLQVINANCFPALLQLAGPQFKLFMDSVTWAFKHTMRDISETGLTIMLELLLNFAKTDKAISNAFFQSYYINIMQDVFFVLTNTMHKSGFKTQTLILMNMFQFVDTNVITAPLFNPAQVANPNMTNQEFVSEFVSNLLQGAFTHVQPVQVRQFVIGFFSTDKDHNLFKGHVRDFLITLKEFQGDNSELFLEEREAEMAIKKKEEMDAALRIPGMVKPHDRPDDGMTD
ncbi:CRM1 C terminal-domain-containing protein [Polychytrium aggregatum]|uniref:CRM1 C terminal-domain-containing protein n=1 Tax=Polychytrium aggregatum TaxID=110093 RepID=UPI0022FED02A|nr:CRM1 C terminal-domain-containing protein [Polychytrium aggregatum]KAI9209722.1 CRM1 C terminal-domain-containing protein [Polychytrium aggregatum]